MRCDINEHINSLINVRQLLVQLYPAVVQRWRSMFNTLYFCPNAVSRALDVGAGSFWGCTGFFADISQICPKNFYATNFLPTNFL